MFARNKLLNCLLFGVAGQLMCVAAFAVPLTGNVRLHDPTRIFKEGDRYYVYSTGGGSAFIGAKYSDNLTHWQNAPGVFNGVPAWAAAEVNPNAGFAWAPDIVYHNGQYRLYYSVSSFGSQNSVIGMATNTTLDFNSPNYQWVDQQMVIESEIGFPYNAIDPGIFHDESTGRMWMTYGSFWNGVYITELDPATGKRTTPNGPTINIARNSVNPPNAIEAPFLTENDGMYYLFVNWDTCCQGSNSTYKIKVGRSASPTGPFVGHNGVSMTQGGGDLFLATEGTNIGPGHFSEFSENGIDYFSYHYYDGADQGRSKLAIDEFSWTYDGWPILVSDLPAGDYNRNGRVDGLDYTMWRNLLGTNDPRANGDNTGESMNIVDEADFVVWKNNFGADYQMMGGGGFVVTVPEPTGLCLATLVGLMLMGRVRSPR